MAQGQRYARLMGVEERVYVCVGVRMCARKGQPRSAAGAAAWLGISTIKGHLGKSQRPDEGGHHHSKK